MAVPAPVIRGISFARFPAWLKPALPWAKWLLTTRPRINRPACGGGGDCTRVFPVQALRVNKGKAIINYSTCIRCFCCHETCSAGAIELVKPIFQRIFV